MSMGQTFKVRIIPKDNPFPSGLELNEYCFLHSGLYEKFSGTKKLQRSGNDVNLYLCVRSSSSKIYLKYRQGNIAQDYAMLSYDNLCRLGLVYAEKDGTAEVTVTKSHALTYIFSNLNILEKFTILLSMVSFLLAIISLFN